MPEGGIGLEGYTKLAHLLQLIFDNTVRKAELRDAVAQDAPQLTKSFVDGDFIAPLSHISSKGEPCWSATYDCDAPELGP